MKSKQIILFAVIFVGSLTVNAQENEAMTIDISLARANFATFTNSRHPGNRIGYRFHEHEPISYGTIPGSNEEAGIEPESVTNVLNAFKKGREVFIYTLDIEKSEHWAQQKWTYYMCPVEDGIEMLWIIQTFVEGLPSYCGVQQCFRMSGATNSEWRKKIAMTPAFSEYDHWKGISLVDERAPLTYVSRNNVWEALPPTDSTVGARTPLGIEIDHKRTGGKPMKKVGPYLAEMLDRIDHGLITRIDTEQIWVCGIFWEHTSHVTDHHPADCLHAIVNIGNIPSNSRRVVKGKIYWFKGTTADLSTSFGKDFAGRQE